MLIPERICTLSLVSTASGLFRTTVSANDLFRGALASKFFIWFTIIICLVFA